MKKLGSIIESKYQQLEEEEEEKEFQEKIMTSSKITGQQLDYQVSSSSSKQLHHSKVQNCLQYHNLKAQIVSMIEQSQYNDLELDSMNFLSQQLQKTFQMILSENPDITEDVTKEVEKFLMGENQLKMIQENQIQDRLYFYDKEYVSKPVQYECSLQLFLFPFSDEQATKLQIQLIICQFLNNRGGIIFLGINPENHLVAGIELQREDKNRFKEFIQNCVSSIEPSNQNEIIFDLLKVHDIKTDFEINNLYLGRIIVQQGRDQKRIYFVRDQQQQKISSFKNVENASEKDIENEEKLLDSTPKVEIEQIKYKEPKESGFMTQSSIKRLRVQAKQDQNLEEEKQTKPSNYQSPSPQKLPVPSTPSPLQSRKDQQSVFDLYFYEKIEDEMLQLVIMQLLDDQYKYDQSYQWERKSDNHAQLIPKTRRQGTMLKGRIEQNQRFIKNMNLIHKIILNSITIYVFDQPNKNQKLKTHAILIIGFNPDIKDLVFDWISYICKQEKLNKLNVEDSNLYSMVVLLSQHDEACRFIQQARSTIPRQAQANHYQNQKKIQVGFCPYFLHVKFYSQEIIEWLKKQPGVKINELPEYLIQIVFEDYKTTLSVYDYLKRQEIALNRYRQTPMIVDFKLH